MAASCETLAFAYMGVYFVSLLLALARALPEAQLLALVCVNSKQLYSPVVFAFGHYTCVVNTPTLVLVHGCSFL